MTVRIHMVTISHALVLVPTPSLAKCVCLISSRLSSVFTYVNLGSLFRFFSLKPLGLAGSNSYCCWKSWKIGIPKPGLLSQALVQVDSNSASKTKQKLIYNRFNHEAFFPIITWNFSDFFSYKNQSLAWKTLEERKRKYDFQVPFWHGPCNSSHWSSSNSAVSQVQMHSALTCS